MWNGEPSVGQATMILQRIWPDDTVCASLHSQRTDGREAVDGGALKLWQVSRVGERAVIGYGQTFDEAVDDLVDRIEEETQ